MNIFEHTPEEQVMVMSIDSPVINAMKTALKLPVAELCNSQRDLMTEHLRLWTAGLVDGDGCICADKKHGLRVLVKQAEHGWSSLYQLQSMLGGCIHENKDETDKWQAQKTWSLSGNSARAFCREMKSYCILKHDQLHEALSYPLFELKAMQMRPVLARNQITGIEQVFGSQHHAARVTGASNISASLRQPNRRASGGFFWSYIDNPIAKDMVVKQQSDIIETLKALKRVEHKAIEQSLTPAYVAGLIDSDGCIDISKEGTRTVSVGQKYIAICQALKQQYGGNFCQDKSTRCFHWKIRGEKAKVMMQEFSPFLISKREQCVIALDKKVDDAVNVRAKMRILKNRLGMVLEAAPCMQ